MSGLTVELISQWSSTCTAVCVLIAKLICAGLKCRAYFLSL